MDTRDFYFRQPLKENELDAFASAVETAMFRIVKDLKLFGLASGGEVTPVSPLVADIAEFTGYDKQGRRLHAGPFSGYDFTNDSSATPNTPSSGHFRWVTFVARHGYLKSDSRTDGNAATVYFIRTETISETGDDTIASAGLLQILQGAEAATADAATRPSVGTDDVIIADVEIDDTGAIIADGVSYSRVTRIGNLVIVPWNALDSYSAGQMVLDGGEVYVAVTASVAPGTTTSDATAWKVLHSSAAPGVYGEPAYAARNARRSRVAGFDHFGFPTGKIVTVDENWLDSAFTTKTATGTGALKGPWSYRINNGGGFAGTGLQLNGSTTGASIIPWGPVLGMNVFGQSVDAAAVVELVHPIIYMQQASLVMEWAFSIFDGGGSGTPLSNSSWAMGLSFGGIISANTNDRILTGAAAFDGAYFWNDGTGGLGQSWGGHCDNGVDPGADTNTGVGLDVDSPHFCKIVVLGTAAADAAGTSRVLMFMDGVLVAEHAISLANNFISPFFRVSASQGEVCILEIGVPRIHARTALNSEFGP